MNNLKQIMAQKGLTYQELSIMVQLRRGEGVSEGTLTKIIRHDHYPSQETRVAISEALGVTDNDIWTGVEENG